MARLVIVIAVAIVVVITGLIIFIVSRGEESSLISQDENYLPPPPIPASITVPVSINAIPWARVFIKLPQDSGFIEPRVQDFTIPPEPNRKNANVTPIRGSLKVPVGTAIKLVCRGKEKIFPYEAWKDGKTISYDFLNQ